jgi:hypothetical protein
MMESVFKKLNLKDQKQIVVLCSPDSFEINLNSIQPAVNVIKSMESASEIAFALLFVTKQEQVDTLIPRIAPKLSQDPVLWMCYPKSSSKKYKCDFNRDTGWAIMGNYELEPVRMVSIDDDWSALRFKKVDFIKKMTRSSLGALSEKGKAKSSKK